jgi:hypothetical protein
VTDAQQQARSRAFEILTEHFESCLLVVASEIVGQDNVRESYVSYDGGQCQALGMSKYAEHRILSDFKEPT